MSASLKCPHIHDGSVWPNLRTAAESESFLSGFDFLKSLFRFLVPFWTE